jgi:hypothetical protein
VIWKLITSREGLIVLAIGLALSLHFADRAYAVKAARKDYVTVLEADTLKAENTRLLKLTAITQKLNNDLEAKKAEADRSLAALEKDIQDYETETAIGADCVVTDQLLDRLR